VTAILDGNRLAQERLPGLRARADLVSSLRGHQPRVALIAFAGRDGRAPYCERKARACIAAGVSARPVVLPRTATTVDVRRAVEHAIEGDSPDAVFLEFPFPNGVDVEAIAALIPDPLDVDVMGDAAVGRFFARHDGEPPLTVSAGLGLLDRYRVDVAGLPAIVIGDPSPFVSMFREALVRRGAGVTSVAEPSARDLEERVGEAGFVVAAASRPRLVRSGRIAPGAVVIDVGYFNPGGLGDVDTRDGIDHLAAIAPVPGGIGPMTISMLIERTIALAERRSPVAGLRFGDRNRHRDEGGAIIR